MTSKVDNEYDLISFPLEGFSIPGIFELGAEVVFSFGYDAGPVEGTMGITAGVILSLADSTGLEIDFLSPDVDAGGWTPWVRTVPMRVDAKIKAEAEIYTKAAIKLTASVFGMYNDVRISSMH